MSVTYSFGEWIKERRLYLHLTQRALADQSFCSTATIKKIETDQRRPSPELVELLAQVLQISPEQHSIFMECARGQRPVDALAATPKPAPPLFRRAAPLPLSATPFIGRAVELAELVDKLANPDCRILTLMGPGGVGKTRLALAAARAQQSTFVDGAVFVSLVTVDDADGLALAIAKALNQPLTGAEPIHHQLQRLLHAKTMLLVLDNFEQLVAEASILASWLADAPNLKLLVTSRERLNLAEEWLYSLAGFSSESAVDLFAQSARRVDPKFDATGQTAAVAAICRLVDGLPLAVELAASWTRLMPCTQIAEQIQQDLDFLSTGPRNAPKRQRSLRALFDHSWRLLSRTEQATLASLSLFQGGFAAEDAAAVTGAPLPVLLGLVDKSLVAAQANGRYDMHELTRRYAAAKLQEIDPQSTVCQQHFNTYLALATRLNTQLHGPDGIAAYARLDQEQANLRVAIKWGLATNQVEPVLHLLHHLWFFWLRRGHWGEGVHWCKAAIDQSDGTDSVPLSLALTHAALFLGVQGRFAEAPLYLSRALPMAHRLQAIEPLLESALLVAQANQDAQTSFAAFEEAIVLAKREERLKWQLAHIHTLYGDRLRGYGRYNEAASHYQQSLRLMQQMGNVDMIAYPLGNLGLLALHEGKLEEAHHLIAESVAIARAVGNSLGISDWIFRLGVVLIYLKEHTAATALLQEALMMYEEMSNLRGQAAVLACLAESALGQGQIALAVKQIGQSLAIYQTLHLQMAQGLPLTASLMSTQFTFSADELDSLLRVVLVFAAQERFVQTATFVRVLQGLMLQSGHETVAPLQSSVDQVLGVARSRLSETVFVTAWERGERMATGRVLAFALAAIA